MPRYICVLQTKLDGSLGERLGSDSFAYCDGRWSRATERAHAERLARKHNAPGYVILAGQSILDAREMSRIIFENNA